jgi:hypothetical protein
MSHNDTAKSYDAAQVGVLTGVRESFRYKTQWVIDKFANDHDALAGKAFEQVVIDGNLLLNAGINLLLTLGAGGAGTAFNNANARIGVGDSTAAEAATQTGLQAATNKTYKAMDATYPTSGTSQQIVFRATFIGTDANYAWQEFTVDNGTISLNRKVSNQGTKVSGQTWTITVTITLS